MRVFKGNNEAHYEPVKRKNSNVFKNVTMYNFMYKSGKLYTFILKSFLSTIIIIKKLSSSSSQLQVFKVYKSMTISHYSDLVHPRKKEKMSKIMLLLSMMTLLLSVMAQRVSPPECTDGSSATCVCGDGSDPNYSKFPPCELKKVT